MFDEQRRIFEKRFCVELRGFSRLPVTGGIPHSHPNILGTDRIGTVNRPGQSRYLVRVSLNPLRKVISSWRIGVTPITITEVVVETDVGNDPSSQPSLSFFDGKAEVMVVRTGS